MSQLGSPAKEGINKVLIERDYTSPEEIRFIEECPVRIQGKVQGSEIVTV
jgi:hypothetical protein